MFSFIKTYKCKEFNSLRQFSIYTNEIKMNSSRESTDIVLIKLLGYIKILDYIESQRLIVFQILDSLIQPQISINARFYEIDTPWSFQNSNDAGLKYIVGNLNKFNYNIEFQGYHIQDAIN